jgi:hypothetical protein
MDLRIESAFHGIFDQLSKRMRSLRKDASEPQRKSRFSLRLDPRFKSFAFAGAFIAIAGLLAWSAQSLTYSHALEDWERSRLPSDRVWTYALGNHGWTLAPPAAPAVHQALKKLPASLDSAGSVWASPDWSWIMVFTDPNQVVSHKLFCRDCKTAPERWDPVGTGWSAFDRVLAQLEQVKTAPVQARKGRKTIKFVDSREIHY